MPNDKRLLKFHRKF